MNWNNAELEAVAGNKKGYPEIVLPEIALCGRSNVGKSSFINKLLNRKNLARTSSTPGKTATINFYNIDNKFRLVDLPGYGYAKRNDAEKAKWTKMIEEYLNSGRISQIFLLIDLRHTPTADDITMNDWILSVGIKRRIIGTKWDKVKKMELEDNIRTIQDALEGNCTCFSSETGKGAEDIRKYFENM